ncbi:hypothetical protein L596_011311 [Steinernema carpocapsae]|uniref:Uncharacterized protein n=1 Tax=Steinernema carpocapsae TaxID=34508 RepID=A0A4U5NUF8_STECR|nr:hypothetical protein L596_011311 [Steinernema carpocapsae]
MKRSVFLALFLTMFVFEFAPATSSLPNTNSAAPASRDTDDGTPTFRFVRTNSVPASSLSSSDLQDSRNSFRVLDYGDNGGSRLHYDNGNSNLFGGFLVGNILLIVLSTFVLIACCYAMLCFCYFWF